MIIHERFSIPEMPNVKATQLFGSIACISLVECKTGFQGKGNKAIFYLVSRELEKPVVVLYMCLGNLLTYCASLTPYLS